MLQVVVVVTGLSLGVLFAYTSVPRVSVLAAVATTVLAATAAAAILYIDRASLVNGFLLVGSAIVSSIVMGGWLWSRSGIGSTRTYWEWVYLGIRSPRTLREAYAKSQALSVSSTP